VARRIDTRRSSGHVGDDTDTLGVECERDIGVAASRRELHDAIDRGRGRWSAIGEHACGSIEANAHARRDARRRSDDAERNWPARSGGRKAEETTAVAAGEVPGGVQDLHERAVDDVRNRHVCRDPNGPLISLGNLTATADGGDERGPVDGYGESA
jgi:hypothetical protein